jgi:hypothetical protein
LPFEGATSPFETLGGSLARVPVDGGRCLWVAETATTLAGASLRNVGLVPSLDEPFGTCPQASSFGDGDATPVVELAGGNDPTILVQIDGGFLVSGETKVAYRLFRVDDDAAYGVDLLGGGIGSWDASTQRIVVPGPDALLWDTSIDPGDASLVVSGTPYLWGCHSPAQFLTYPCAMARLDGDEVSYLTTGGAWLADAAVSDTATVFSAGPWISSVGTTASTPSESGTLSDAYWTRLAWTGM